MTRLTNEMRESMLTRIMYGLPNVNYLQQIKDLVQKTIIEFAPKEVQTLYGDEKLRNYLADNYVEIKDGNGYRSMIYERVYGLSKGMTIQMDPRTEAILKDGTLLHAIYTRLRDSNLMAKRQEQEELRQDVRTRLKANLASVTTIKRLYEVLEPELHGFIPRVAEGKSTLPSCVAPVVDDLKKLGLVVPETPKQPHEVTQ